MAGGCASAAEAAAPERSAARLPAARRATSTARRPRPDPEHDDRVMLVRARRSRIYSPAPVLRLPHPVEPRHALQARAVPDAADRVVLPPSGRPIRDDGRPRAVLHQPLRRRLYRTFFKSYTEKVWGRRCVRDHRRLGRPAGQRALDRARRWTHFAKPLARAASADSPRKATGDVAHRAVPLPQARPRADVGRGRRRGAVLAAARSASHGWRVDGLETDGTARHRASIVEDARTARASVVSGRLRFLDDADEGSRPRRRDRPCRPTVAEVAEGLVYRDFITVGLLLRQPELARRRRAAPDRDNWIYIQEPDVKVGRLQIFNNWSPYMVADPQQGLGRPRVLLQRGRRPLDADPTPSDRALASAELAHASPIIDRRDVLDGVVIRVPKTYPAYFGTYDRFDELRAWLDRFENLFLRRPQRHAPLQQPGPLDARRDGRRRQHRRRPHRQGRPLGRQHGGGVPRGALTPPSSATWACGRRARLRSPRRRWWPPMRRRSGARDRPDRATGRRS